MKVWHRREFDGAIHRIDCTIGKLVKEIIYKDSSDYIGISTSYTVFKYRTIATKYYPKVIVISATGPTEKIAYKKLSDFELALAKKLNSEHVTIARTFHDTPYKMTIGLSRKQRIKYLIERAVYIYTIEK
jgi:hypothetical protein